MYSLLGSAVALALCHALWSKLSLTLIVGGLLSTLWTVLVWSYREMQQDDRMLLKRIQAHVAAQDPLLRLAVALAQPMRGLSLGLPIPLLTPSFDDWGLYEPGRLPPDALAKARQQLQAWLAQVNEQTGEPAQPDDFETFAAIFLGGAPSSAEHWAPDTSARLCWHLNLLLCGMETGALSAGAGRVLLKAPVRALQARHADWTDYAAALKPQRWDFVKRDLWGTIALAVQFRDLSGSALSPWAMTPLDTPLPTG